LDETAELPDATDARPVFAADSDALPCPMPCIEKQVESVNATVTALHDNGEVRLTIIVSPLEGFA
jgi:hypothetical protein